MSSQSAAPCRVTRVGEQCYAYRLHSDRLQLYTVCGSRTVSGGGTMFVCGIGERGVNWRWSPAADASRATACSATGPLVSDRALYGYGHGAVWYGVSGWSMDSQASRALSSLDISH